MAATSTDQPEPIRTEFHQMRIVGHEQDGPLPDRQRLDQRLACVDVEMVRRLVEQEDMRRVPRHRRDAEAGLLAATARTDPHVGARLWTPAPTQETRSAGK